MDQELLKILACPQCRGSLDLQDNRAGLACMTCQVVYPVENDIPVLLRERGVPLEPKKKKVEDV